MRVATSTLLLLTLTTITQAEDIELRLPIACEIGKTCWVQNYVDHDPSAAVKDYSCGGQTYDGHDGTDIRVLNAISQANVIASAAGIVRGLRDGVADNLMRTEADRAAVQNRECGNGVVIDHAGGWQTQYCHMRRGSVTVKTGDKVEAGTKLGEVGYSGMAAFPHVHLTIRKDGKALDPFGGKADGGENCGAPVNPLWNSSVAAALDYQEGQVIQSGFNPAPVELASLENGTLPKQNPDAKWPALVAYAWAINLAEGDEVTVSLQGPNGIEATNTVTLDRNKATYMLFAGKKQPAGGWPPGEYVGSIKVVSAANDNAAKFVREWRAKIE